MDTNLSRHSGLEKTYRGADGQGQGLARVLGLQGAARQNHVRDGGGRGCGRGEGFTIGVGKVAGRY